MSEVSLTEAVPRSVAGIGVFRDAQGFRAAMQAAFGVTPPGMPGFVQAGGMTLSCLSPTRYQLSGERGSGLPEKLGSVLDGLAAVTDQSDLWRVFTIAGRDVRTVLARIVPIDLHSVKFPVGALACTRAGHLDVRLWHLEDMSYELSVGRSYAADLHHAVSAASGTSGDSP